jgi:Uma2 family endonuclease
LTAEDLVSLPDDGIDRELIRGELREWPTFFHTPLHAEARALIGYRLSSWIRDPSQTSGTAVSGAGFRLRRDPDTCVGIDVAYISAELAADIDRTMMFFDGPPILAIEILAPWDPHERMVEKAESFLEAGSVVWIADPDFRTITVHRPGEAPVMFNDRQELDGDPYLPGFRTLVRKLFKS